MCSCAIEVIAAVLLIVQVTRCRITPSVVVVLLLPLDCLTVNVECDTCHMLHACMTQVVVIAAAVTDAPGMKAAGFCHAV